MGIGITVPNAAGSFPTCDTGNGSNHSSYFLVLVRVHGIARILV